MAPATYDECAQAGGILRTVNSASDLFPIPHGYLLVVLHHSRDLRAHLSRHRFLGLSEPVSQGLNVREYTNLSQH